MIRASVCECEWVSILSGSMCVRGSGEVEGYGDFSTALLLAEAPLRQAGCYYYEVQVLTKGIMQVRDTRH